MARSKDISVEALRHKDKRRNIPTAELEPVMDEADKRPKPLRYPRNTDIDPQLVWRGKDDQDWSDLIVQAPPLYIQEKIHPKVLVDDLLRQSRERREEANPPMPNLFADFNGLPDKEARTEFYQHDANWSNRMILGDSLSVMASLAEREGLRGKVQCIYIDPPYGVRFNSNFQWSTTTRDVKDNDRTHITREPEQVKAFRDTWRDGCHSYLTYLRDRLTVTRDLLKDSGSIFIQIGDENVHRVRALMDEVFGEDNLCGQICVLKTSGAGSPAIGTDFIPSVADTILWYARDKGKNTKYRRTFTRRLPSDDGNYRYVRESHLFNRALKREELREVNTLRSDQALFRAGPITSQTGAPTTTFPVSLQGHEFRPGKGGWKTNSLGMQRLHRADRLLGIGNTLSYIRFFADFPVIGHNNVWADLRQSGFGDEKIYVVQTAPRIVERCLLMATDPGRSCA